ncbi:uncharacterized protein LOC131289153 isoform X2 [Anopheles ziemanni]|uniref:uncharacterized protein LOC131261027 isoform X2 n=1 Tax=Anopheles coustani TaxID=139045 RepID=UPI002657D31A|nr:uncharacterized protein LOC131261027 isoform X2 [Anopheles coustani]XP_058174344.1 uncharacterized protein LOC131289153 isoform X2 [Anopheles ziemanni]
MNNFTTLRAIASFGNVLVRYQFCAFSSPKQYGANRYYSQSTTKQGDGTMEDYKNAKSVYDFTVKDSHGADVSLEKYRGKVLLIVNIASQCGLTKGNYAELTELSKQYADKEFKILSFPCNQFGGQMPEGDGEEMVCHLRSANAEVGDVFAKIDVNGDGAHPLYKYLKHKQGGTLGDSIKWNFAKFLVNREGQPVDRYAPTTSPSNIKKDIDKLLG